MCLRLPRLRWRREGNRVGLDVFEDEPAMKAGLAECDNAVVVPHIASASLWTRSGMVRNPPPQPPPPPPPPPLPAP